MQYWYLAIARCQRTPKPGRRMYDLSKLLHVLMGCDARDIGSDISYYIRSGL